MKKWLFLICVTGICATLSGCVTTAMVTSQAVGSNLSLGQQTKDYLIEAKALSDLQSYPEITEKNTQCSVDLTVFNGVILLTGEVPNKALKTEIPKTLASIPNTKEVYNALTVGPVAGFWNSTKDSLLSARVKTALTGPVNSLHFKVLTEDNIVYLLGKTTPAEGKLAAKIASQISGVDKVVTAYWYMQPTASHLKHIAIH